MMQIVSCQLSWKVSGIMNKSIALDSRHLFIANWCRDRYSTVDWKAN